MRMIRVEHEVSSVNHFLNYVRDKTHYVPPLVFLYRKQSTLDADSDSAAFVTVSTYVFSKRCTVLMPLILKDEKRRCINQEVIINCVDVMLNEDNIGVLGWI